MDPNLTYSPPRTPPGSPIRIDTNASPVKERRLPLLLQQHPHLFGMEIDRPASAPTQLPSDFIAYSFLGAPPVFNRQPTYTRMRYADFLAKSGVSNETILRWIRPPPFARQAFNYTARAPTPDLTHTGSTNTAEQSSDEASGDAEDDQTKGVVVDDLAARVAALGKNAVTQATPNNTAAYRALMDAQKRYSHRARIMVGNLPNDIDKGILALAVEEEFGFFGECYVHVFSGNMRGLRPYAIVQYTVS